MLANGNRLHFRIVAENLNRRHSGRLGMQESGSLIDPHRKRPVTKKQQSSKQGLREKKKPASAGF